MGRRAKSRGAGQVERLEWTGDGGAWALTRPAGAAWTAVMCGAVAFATLLVHARSLTCQARCFDDNLYLVNNYQVKNPGILTAARFFKEVLQPTSGTGYYQPITLTSLMIDYWISGTDSNLRIYHITSLLIHVLNTALVALLFYLLFGNLAAAAIGGLLFGAHPLTVEPVVWLAARKAVLAGLFVSASLVFYVLSTRGSRYRIGWTALAALSQLLALLSKPTALPFPLILLVLDFWPLQRLTWKALFEKWPYFLMSLIFAIITLISHATTSSIQPHQAYGIAQTPLVACCKLAFGLFKIVWPFPLSGYYPLPLPISLRNPLILFAILVTLVCAAALILGRRRVPALSAAALFLTIPLLPMLVFQYGVWWIFIFDNYLYIPLVGFAMAGAWWAGRLLDRGARAAVIAAAVLLFFAEAAFAIHYTGQWKTTDTLMAYMSRLTPGAWPIESHLAGIRYAQGKYEEALKHNQNLKKLIPVHPEPYDSLGLCYHDLGQIELDKGNKEKAAELFNKAEENFKKSIELDPSRHECYSNYARTLDVLGRPYEAIKVLNEAMRLKPDYPEALNSLGVIYMKQQRLDDAIEVYKRVLALRPNLSQAHYGLANAYLQRKQIENAIPRYQDAVRYNPTDDVSYYELGLAFWDINQPQLSMRAWQEAIKIGPQFPQYHFRLGTAYEVLEQYDAAILEYEITLRQLPNHPDAARRIEIVKQKQAGHFVEEFPTSQPASQPAAQPETQPATVTPTSPAAGPTDRPLTIPGNYSPPPPAAEVSESQPMKQEAADGGTTEPQVP